MSQLVFVRHGQANTGARDEQDYDRLSALGHDQSRWLGAHFHAVGEVFAQVWTGTLRRHVETAEGIGAATPGPIFRDARLNELEYFTMANLLEAQHGIPLPNTREGFVAHLPQLFTYWSEDRIAGVPESYASFEDRVSAALQDLQAAGGRTLVVTSGGIIAMVMRLTLRLDLAAWTQVALSIQNTSVHRWLPLDGALAVTQFNAIPHLDTPERLFAQTHI